MKRKEKPLTLEELKAKLTQQNLENWVHSEPHFSLFAAPGGMALLPLSKNAETDLFVVFLVDLTHYSFDLVLETIERMNDEYKGLPWKPLIITEKKYLFLRENHFFDRFRHHKSFANTSLFFDTKGEWFEHFQGEGGVILLLHRGAEVLRLPLKQGFSSQIIKIEEAFQDGLRLEDPGLPLYTVKEHSFTKSPDHRIVPAGELIQKGNWITTPGSIVTEDSNAQVAFHFEGSHLRLVGTPHPDSREASRFIITLNDEPIPSAHFGASTRLGEKSSSISEIGKSQGICELISASSPLRGEVKIQFLNAVENPVIIYGIRAS